MSSWPTPANAPADGTPVAIADFGKSRTKVSIVSSDGELLESLDTPTTLLAQPTGGTFDIEALAKWCEDALVTLHQKYRFRKLIPITHGATAVIVQRDQPLPVQDYEESIPSDISDLYDRIRPDFTETGSPGLPAGLNLGRQLITHELLSPTDPSPDTVILTYPQYWVWRWTGLQGTDISSLGCHTDLWNPRKNAWSSLAMQRGWAQKFPPLVAAGTLAGPLSGQLAERIGTHSVDVHWGVHDSNAALAAFLGSAEPFTLLSTGTWLIAFAIGGDTVGLDAARDTLLNVDVNGRPVAAARFMAGREREVIAGNAPAASIAEIEQILRSNSLALPAFTPGGPFPDHAGKIIEPLPTTGGERAALAGLYTALMIDAMLDLIGAHGSIIVEGPLASDTASLQVLATLRPQQTVKATHANCVAHGALRLVLGSDLVKAPAARDVLPHSGLAELLQTKRAQWLRELRNAS